MPDYEHYNLELFPLCLLRARKLRGLTQEQLAHKMEYGRRGNAEDDEAGSRSNIANYEAGRTKKPSLATLCKLANALNCDIEYLLGVIDTPHKAAADVHETIGISNEASEKLISILGLVDNMCADFISSIIEHKRFLDLAMEWSSCIENAQKSTSFEESYFYIEAEPETRYFQKLLFDRKEAEKSDVNEYRFQKECMIFIASERKKANAKKSKP